MKVICISGKAGHGKDTAANFIKEQLDMKINHDYFSRVRIAHFGDLVKHVARVFFDWDGQKNEYGRELLQTIGTDIVRAEEPDYWVGFIADMLEFFEQAWDYVIIPDARFPGEIEHLIKRGFDVTHIRVIRENYISDMPAELQNHESETALDDYIPDVYVHNSGYLGEFYDNLLMVMDELKL